MANQIDQTSMDPGRSHPSRWGVIGWQGRSTGHRFGSQVRAILGAATQGRPYGLVLEPDVPVGW